MGCSTSPDAASDAGALTPVIDAGNDPLCAADLDVFRREVWAPILSLSCVGCHNPAGTARATRMVLHAETEPGWLEHNFRAVRVVATATLADEPLLLLRPAGRHPMGHTGGRITPPGSTGYAALERFVALARAPSCDATGDGGVTPPPRCATVTPGPRLLRRLTPTEYDRTVRDLTGVESHHGEGFVADPVVEGFDNDAASLVVSPLLADQLRVAAESIAAEVTRDVSRVAPCTPASPTDAACARRAVESFGERAFRRPMTEAEVTRYLGLFSTIAAGEGFNEGIEAVVTAMLQSPHFLYRSELGARAAGSWRLTPWEVATELSYLLTGTMPDAALFAAARANALATPEQLTAQVRRLLATPGARESLRRFVRQWLDVDRLATVPKDPATFADFTPAVRASMAGEFDRFIDATLLRPGARLPDLFTTRTTFIDPTLAMFYGLTATGEADAQGFRSAAMVEPQRVGVLTLGAVMATHARPNSSSPVHRGRAVRERLLCQPLPPPPPGVNAQPPTPDRTRSLREQYAQHSSEHPCVDCHRLMDPIGFGFEFFDGVGRYRATENGAAIDARAEVLGSASTNGTAADTNALVERLAESPEVHDCFARQLFRYAYALSSSGEQTACALSEVQARFRASELSVEGLVLALTRSVHFTERAGDDAVVDDAGVGDAGATDAAVVDAGSRTDVVVVDAGSGPVTTPGLRTTTVRDSTWDTGFCERVQVENTTRETVTWTVVHTVMGTINNSWNSEREGDTGAVVFRGATWNRTLRAGEQTELGFCASR
ncbi:MAG: DUF1592 domain-containing protein [Polyangiales bacterium]